MMGEDEYRKFNKATLWVDIDTDVIDNENYVNVLLIGSKNVDSNLVSSLYTPCFNGIVLMH